MRLETLQEKLKPWIAREKPLLVVWFGSSLTGLPGPESDLDLAVLFRSDPDPWKALEGISALLERDDVDLMVLNHADPIARMSASEGSPVYEDRPSRFAEFQSLAHRQYMDTEPIRKARREMIDKFLKERGFE